MRPIWAIAVVIVVGCTAQERPKALERFARFGPGTRADAIRLDVAIVHMPLGDRYINHDVWAAVDEQIVPLELKPHLKDNGMRVGRLSGPPPERLQELLTSESNCIRARRLTFNPDKNIFFPIGPKQDEIQIKINDPHTKDAPEEARQLKLKAAQCGMRFRSSMPNGQEFRLHLEPSIRHGDRTLLPRPNKDLSQWTLVADQPEETFSSLSFDIQFRENEYLIIGGLTTDRTTLGYKCFVSTNLRGSDQYLMVIRGFAPPASTTIQAGTTDAESNFQDGPVPLILQSIVKSKKNVAAARGQSSQ